MAEPDISRIFQNLGEQLQNVSAVVGTQSISQVVPYFDGDTKQFKYWIKNIEKYGVLTGLDSERLKMVAYQSSKNAVSDFIQRYLKSNPDDNWDTLKGELKSRFSEVQDPQHAFCLLRAIKQTPGENVQIYAERLLTMAEEAFVGHNGDLIVIERQLIGFFIDGLAHDFLKMKVMRENPDTLQAAVRSATNEQNLRTRFNLRIGNAPSQNSRHDISINDRHEPMEIDHLRPNKYCIYCRRPGHNIKDCKSRKREINAIGKEFQVQNNQISDRPNNDWKSKIECWNCGKMGHFQRECRNGRRPYYASRNQKN